jgi:hypothetical protein
MVELNWCFAQTRTNTDPCPDPRERTQRESTPTTWLAQSKQASCFNSGYVCKCI